MVVIVDMRTKQSYDYPNEAATEAGVANALELFSATATKGTVNLGRAYSPTKDLFVVVVMEASNGR
jgi:hypothetical protein